MPNVFSKMFALLLAVLVLYCVPTYQLYKKQEEIAYLNTHQVVTEFVDNVRTKGFITRDMYEQFLQKLNVGEVLYTVEMTHKHKIYVPVYTDPTNQNSFTGEYKTQYDEFYKEQIEKVLYADLNDTDVMYKLENGDYFKIYVENKTKFRSTMLFDFFTGGIANDNDVVVSVPYGGMVLNEDY